METKAIVRGARMSADKGRLVADLIHTNIVQTYHLGQVGVHAHIKVRLSTWYDADGKRMDEPEIQLIETTVGRVLFNRILATV